MHTGRAFVTLLLAATLLTLLTTCNMSLSVPNYSLEFRGTTAYPAPATATVEYRYTAEENVQRCRYVLTNSAGTELDSGTCFVPADQWQTYDCDLPAEDRYTFRVVVQAQKPSGEFVDLAFLAKSLDLYVDLQDPAVPTIDPTPVLSSHPLAVTLRPALDNLTGSPVSLYYTLDGSTPGEGSSKYAGSPLVLPLSDTPKTLKVVAIDGADRTSPVQSHSYSFMNLVSTAPAAIAIGDGFQAIDLYGYGLLSVEAAQLYDSDYPEGTLTGTGVSTAIMPGATDTHLRIAVDPEVVVSGSLPFDPGTGFVWVKDNDTGETDTIAIQITN